MATSPVYYFGPFHYDVEARGAISDYLREWEGEFLRTAGDDALLRPLREASPDDEPTTPEEDAGAEDAWQEYQQGKALPWEKVRKELAGD
jgi:hypothetical protein